MALNRSPVKVDPVAIFMMGYLAGLASAFAWGMR